MPRSTAIQSERARRCSPRASTSPASFNRHSPDSRPVGPDFPSLDVPPQRNSIAIDPIGSQTAGLLTPDLRTCPVFVIEAHLCRRVLGQALDQSPERRDQGGRCLTSLGASSTRPAGTDPHPPALTEGHRVVEPRLCWALEDSHNGVRSTVSAGMMTIMVPDLLEPTDEIRRLCTIVARDLHEVRRLIQSL
jgi:hypothetical protein